MDLLKEIGVAVARYSGLLKEQERLEQKLKTFAGEIRVLEEQVLPDMLEAAQLEEIVGVDGRRLVIDRSIHSSVTKERTEAAYKWLRENGHAAVIKTQVIVEFPMNSDAEALALAKELTLRNSLNVKQESKVHPSTLKALVKKLVEQEAPIPEDVFGIYHQRKIKVDG